LLRKKRKSVLRPKRLPRKQKVVRERRARLKKKQLLRNRSKRLKSKSKREKGQTLGKKLGPSSLK